MNNPSVVSSAYPTTVPPASLPSGPVWYKQRIITYVGIVLLGILVLGLLSKWSDSRDKYSKTFLRRVRTLMEEATRWHATAKQDTNPLMKITHCNYALVYAKIARALASEAAILRITGLDINELVYFMEEAQAQALQEVSSACPSLKIDGVYSIGTQWM